MGIKDKERRNEYSRRKWKERRDAKLLALGINPKDRPVGGVNGNRGQAILPNENTLPAEIRLRRQNESDDEYHARYNRERINHWNSRNREHVAERARKNYAAKRESYKAAKKKWIELNRDKFDASQKRYFEKHREKRLSALNAWAARNPEKVKAAKKKYQMEHPAIFRSATAKCRAQILRAAPEWVNWSEIRKIYQKSANHNRSNPSDKWQVDHIIPLNHPEVCGLHVLCNLRIISAIENQRKGNRWSQEEGIAPMNGD